MQSRHRKYDWVYPLNVWRWLVLSHIAKAFAHRHLCAIIARRTKWEICWLREYCIELIVPNGTKEGWRKRGNTTVGATLLKKMHSSFVKDLFMRCSRSWLTQDIRISSRSIPHTTDKNWILGPMLASRVSVAYSVVRHDTRWSARFCIASRSL